MSFDRRADASAARLIAHFGDGLTVTIRSIGGSIDATRTVTTSIQSMTVPCTKPEPFSERLVDGTRIQAGDLRISIQHGHPARTFDPKPEMLADLSGVTYRVVNAEPVAGGFDLQLRSGA